MSTPDPTAQTEHFGAIAGSVIAIAVFVAGLVRFLLRPLFDKSVLAAWKRESSDVERFMRDGMFARDFEERRQMSTKVDQALGLAAANASAIAAMTTDQGYLHSEVRAMGTLLSGIPHLAGTMEQMCERLDEFNITLRDNNRIGRENSETLAAHGALLGERRVQGRRVTDPSHALGSGEKD